MLLVQSLLHSLSVALLENATLTKTCREVYLILSIKPDILFLQTLKTKSTNLHNDKVSLCGAVFTKLLFSPRAILSHTFIKMKSHNIFIFRKKILIQL